MARKGQENPRKKREERKAQENKVQPIWERQQVVQPVIKFQSKYIKG